MDPDTAVNTILSCATSDLESCDNAYYMPHEDICTRSTSNFTIRKGKKNPMQRAFIILFRKAECRGFCIVWLTLISESCNVRAETNTAETTHATKTSTRKALESIATSSSTPRPSNTQKPIQTFFWLNYLLIYFSIVLIIYAFSCPLKLSQT